MRLGIDLGGTKIEIIALDGAGQVCLRRRVPTPRGDYGATLAAIADLVHGAEATLGVRGSVGIGTPGALSEATDGAAAGAPVVFGVILGTGTGAGIVVHGRLLTGPNAIAGEWGHNPLPWPRGDELPGPACYCGRQGCLETWLSGPGLARLHEARTGEALAAHDIAARAAAGDDRCEATLAQYEERLARGLAHVINLLDPDVIVLGGGLSNLERLYVNVPRLWQPYVFSDRVDTRLVRNRHGDSSGVRGAAWLWNEGQ